VNFAREDRGSHAPQTGGPVFYGLGWNLGFGRHGLTWGHAGAFSVGARSLVTLFPEEELGIVILANAFPTGVPEGLSDSFADLVFDGTVEKDWVKPWDAIYEGLLGPAVAAAKAAYAAPPSPATPAEPDSAYAGRYFNDFVGEAVLSNEGMIVRHELEGRLAEQLASTVVVAASSNATNLIVAMAKRAVAQASGNAKVSGMANP